MRAGDPQLRPMHLLLHPLPRPHRRSRMSVPSGVRGTVIGVGNEFRRDDGFGPAAVAPRAGRQARDGRLAAVDLRASDGEPTALLELWRDADLAVVVDAVQSN